MEGFEEEEEETLVSAKLRAERKHSGLSALHSVSVRRRAVWECIDVPTLRSLLCPQHLRIRQSAIQQQQQLLGAVVVQVIVIVLLLKL